MTDRFLPSRVGGNALYGEINLDKPLWVLSQLPQASTMISLLVGMDLAPGLQDLLCPKCVLLYLNHGLPAQ